MAIYANRRLKRHEDKTRDELILDSCEALLRACYYDYGRQSGVVVCDSALRDVESHASEIRRNVRVEAPEPPMFFWKGRR